MESRFFTGLENKRLKVTPQNAHSHKNELEYQLAQSLESNRVGGKDLQKAFKEVELQKQRMHYLNYALEQEPSKYADVDLEIKMRDERCSSLATRADACLTR